MSFTNMPQEIMKNRLAIPQGKVDVLLDTDTFNEIDDQFAITYACMSPDKINLKAITAAPFKKQCNNDTPAEGMHKSFDEILRVLDCLNISSDGFVFKGSESFLQSKTAPVKSAAVDTIIELARKQGTEPLYVVAIGAITNVASALIAAPDIAEKIVVVWLGGHPHYWPTAREFNLLQDVPSAQVVFDSGVPLVQVPCKNVAEHLRTTVWEMEKYVKGKGAIGDFLFRIFCDYSADHYGWSKEVWDIAPVAWLINSDWAPSDIVVTPELLDDMTWKENDSRHLCRVLTDIRRDTVFRDFFDKLDSNSRNMSENKNLSEADEQKDKVLVS